MSGERREEREASAWRAAYRGLQAPGSEECPSDERLAALATGELARDPHATHDERLALADHAASCRRCSATLRMLLELDREAEGGVGAAVAVEWRRPLAWAASVLLVSALAVVGWRVTSAPDDGLRSTTGDVGVVPAPGAELDAAPLTFLWPPNAASAGARVRLFDARGELLWEQFVTTPGRAELPAEVAARMQPSDSYFWVVDGGTAGGPRLGPNWFRLDGRR